MDIVPGKPLRFYKTKFASVPLWLLETGASDQAIKIYSVLAGYWGHYETVMPKIETIAEKSGKSRSAVKRALNELRQLGAIRTEYRRRSDGSRTADEYHIAHDEPFPVDTNEQGSTSEPLYQGSTYDPALEGSDLNQQEEDVFKQTKDMSETATQPTDAPPREDVERLCLLLADLVEQNSTRRPKIGKLWRDSARLMLDRDGRTEEQISGAIRYSQGHAFWHRNILSMAALRKQYDRLWLDARAERGYKPTAAVAAPVQRAPHCGDIDCDEATRMKDTPTGVVRCPDCGTNTTQEHAA